MTTTKSMVMFLNLNDGVCFHVAITHNLFLFNVLAGTLVTEKDLNAGHTEASETVGMCRIRIIHYDWHSNSVLYIYIYIYIYTFLILFR